MKPTQKRHIPAMKTLPGASATGVKDSSAVAAAPARASRSGGAGRGVGTAGAPGPAPRAPPRLARAGERSRQTPLLSLAPAGAEFVLPAGLGLADWLAWPAPPEALRARADLVAELFRRARRAEDGLAAVRAEAC